MSPPVKRSANSRKSATPAAARTARPPGRRGPSPELLQAATEVFSRKGYADASVQDVADVMGILKGSLYYYIDTKEDLLFWLLEDVHQHVEQILDEVLALPDLPPLEWLAEYVRRQVVYNLDNLKRISVYYHDSSKLSDKRLAQVQRLRKPHETFVRKMITQAQERGEVRAEIDDALVANYVFGTIIWVYRWYRPGSRFKRSDVADMAARYAIGGLTAA